MKVTSCRRPRLLQSAVKALHRRSFFTTDRTETACRSVVPGLDTLIDGDASGSADSDVLDGRRGGAIVSYASRTAPVVVDLLDPSAAGEAGERDQLRSIDGVVGGSSGDVLRGDGFSNRFQGGPGADRISGRGGDDYIDGGSGEDRLFGDSGDDYLTGGPDADTASGGTGGDTIDGGAGHDRLRGGDGPDFLGSGAASCGRGDDTVRPDSGDYIARDCEMARFALQLSVEGSEEKTVRVTPIPVSADGRSVTLRVQCPYLDDDGILLPQALRGRVRITSANGRLFGRAEIPAAGRRCTRSSFLEGVDELSWVRVRVQLTRAGRAAMHARRPSIARIAFSGTNVPPVPWSVGWRAIAPRGRQPEPCSAQTTRKPTQRLLLDESATSPAPTAPIEHVKLGPWLILSAC
jgi:hypothetical protein